MLRLLGEYYATPVWLTVFPSAPRGFYYIENAEKPGYDVDWNLIVPEGHGEVLNDGCREYRVEELKKESSPQAKTLQNINGSLTLFRRDM